MVRMVGMRASSGFLLGFLLGFLRVSLETDGMVGMVGVAHKVATYTVPIQPMRIKIQSRRSDPSRFQSIDPDPTNTPLAISGPLGGYHCIPRIATCTDTHTHSTYSNGFAQMDL